ncbi:Rof/RNase P-like protein [Irpex rosettiformis]|uniref:Rof/RNase P-like protein n=1 Tax=Irpex rosettiformis TaxID=378272 RepID=A0ACB8UIV5_9APHY|nr:Rof/RNase P-like protein [Irpex rosettiformis]
MYTTWPFAGASRTPTSSSSKSLQGLRDDAKPDGVRAKYNSVTPFTPEYVKGNATRSSDPAQLYANRIQGRQILLQNPPRDSRAKKEREANKARRAAHNARSAAGVLGQTHAREKGLWKLDKSAAKFQRFVAMHRLWLGYMSELLALKPPPPDLGRDHDHAQVMPNVATMHAKLIKAEFVGAMITIRQSKNPCLVGHSGIVYHETENAFKIVTREDQQKLIPKANSIFTFSVPLHAFSPPTEDASSTEKGSITVSADQLHLSVTSLPPDGTVLDLPHLEFELYGNQFCFRSADRATRKFKHKETIEL